MAPPLPGLIGPAPPPANAPPGTAPSKGGGPTDGKAFATAMAAARERTSARGDPKPANQDPAGDTASTPDATDATPAPANEATTEATAALDLAHLLLGLLPGAGTATATASTTKTAPQPDRPAGAEGSDPTGMREAFQALMALLLGSQTAQAPNPTATAGATPTGAQGVAPATDLAHLVSEIAQLLQQARTAPAGATKHGDASSPLDAITQLLSSAPQPADGGVDLAAIANALRQQPSATSRALADTLAPAPAPTPGGAASTALTALTAPPAPPADGTLAASLQALAEAVQAATGGGASRAASDATATAGGTRTAAAPALPGIAAEGAGHGAQQASAELQAQLAGAQLPASGTAHLASAAAGAEAPVPAHDQAAFVARVADAIQHATLVGTRELRLVLNPPELGQLTVHIQDTAQGVRVMLQASTADARDLLQQHLPQLQSALQSRDLRLERLQVGYTSASLSQGALDWNGAAFQGGRQGSQQGGSQAAVWSPVAALSRGASASTATLERTTVARPPARDGGVDLRA